MITGHDTGLITIALVEADDAERERPRASMGEPYRTLLGHFRHEITHDCWDRLVRGDPSRAACLASRAGAGHIEGTRESSPSMTFVDASLTPRRRSGEIKLHGPDAFAAMRRAGRLAAEALDLLVAEVRPGATGEALDRLVRDFALDHGAYPATLLYRGYRHSICTSVNHVVCHGIPDAKPWREGDIVNIDVTLVLDGWHGDSSRMYAVGEVSRRAQRLIDVTHEALMRGIRAIRPGGSTGDIGHAIQTYAEGERCSVVRDFCGHGLGRLFHDEPNILHYGRPGEGVPLKPGMFFTVEPMINLGRAQVKVLSDGWTAVTRDRQLSAQFEHSVGVTDAGVEIFTLSPKGLDKPPFAPP